MSRYKMITSRFRDEWRKDTGMRSITNAIDGTVAAMDRLHEKSGELRKTGRYSEAGLADEIRKFAATDPAPMLRKGQLAVEAFKANLAQCRENLKVPKPDKTDVAGAILRMDTRNWLRQLAAGQAAAFLLQKDTPIEILQAAMEVPPAMIGTTPELMAKIQEHLLSIHHGETIERIEEMDEAATVVKSTIDIALNDFRTVTMFDRTPDNEFKHWLGQAWRETELQHKRDQENEANRQREERERSEQFARLTAPKPPTILDRRVDAIKAGEYVFRDGEFLYTDPELNEAA